jgi:ArsR family transcriptional regulator
MDRDLYEARAQILKAMAHPSRLMILDALTSGEKRVCDLQAVVGADMSTVSRHLAVMKSAGLLEDRREGNWIYYRLRVPCVMSFFGCVEAVLRRDLEEYRRILAGLGQTEPKEATL